MNSDYRSPILAQIIRGFAWIAVFGTVILAVLALRFVVNGSTVPFQTQDSQWEALAVRVVAFLPAAAQAVTALVLFGFAQLIDYIGQIAFNTANATEAIERHGTHASSRGKDKQATLKAIADNTKRNPLPAAPVQPSRPAAPVMPLPRFYYLDTASQPTGPVTAAELRQFVLSGTLANDSLVCPEGGQQWARLDQVVTP